MAEAEIQNNRHVYLAVLVAALGYFVDIYDLILFSIVRVDSLSSLGCTGACLEQNGMWILNMQMLGMLLGGVVWGILGDKKGRLSVLFGSILLYSLANIANAFVQNIEQYAWVRLVAGFGLAGELGAGITLVGELMSREKRGNGTTVVVTVGAAGAIFAGILTQMVSWQTAYLLGGGLGLSLLALRLGIRESVMFHSVHRRKDWEKRGLDPGKDAILVAGDFNCSLMNPEFAKERTIRGLFKEGWVSATERIAWPEAATVRPDPEGKYPSSDFDHILLSPGWVALLRSKTHRGRIYAGFKAGVLQDPNVPSDHWPVVVRF